MKTFNQWLLENQLNQNHFDQSFYTINGSNYSITVNQDLGCRL